MTPHPQRCETCKHQKCEHTPEITNGYYTPRSKFAWNHTRVWGCASHTPAKSEQEIREKVLNELRIIVCELYDDGFKDPLVTFDAAVNKLRYGNLKFHQQGEQR